MGCAQVHAVRGAAGLGGGAFGDGGGDRRHAWAGGGGGPACTLSSVAGDEYIAVTVTCEYGE